MSFTDVINKIHWEQKKSINELSKSCGVCRTTFIEYAKTFNLKLRNIQDATKINPPTGKRNWMTGRNKNNCKVCKAKSDLMKKNNPGNNDSIRIKMSKSMACFFKQNPLPQEIVFRETLDKNNVEYIFQHPINRYIIDFFIPHKKLCIEIDTLSKWGKTRRIRAAIKDKFLSDAGYFVLRINKYFSIFCNTLAFYKSLENCMISK
jgi:very-short-patch-repair endonuclease